MHIDPTNKPSEFTHVDAPIDRDADEKVSTVSRERMSSPKPVAKQGKEHKFTVLSSNSPITKLFENQIFGPQSKRAGAMGERVDIKSGGYKTMGEIQRLKQGHAEKKGRLVEYRKRETELKLSPELSDIEKMEHDQLKAKIPMLREVLASIEHELNILENPKVRAEENIGKLKSECGGKDFSVELPTGETAKGMRFGKDPKSSFDPTEKTVILFTGSGDRTENYAAPMVPEIQDLGLQVVIVNPPGFGESEGRATANSYLETGDALYEQLRSEGAEDSNLCVMGYSLGGAMAANLASKHPLPMVGDRTYTSMEDVAKAETKRATKETIRIPGLKSIVGKAAGAIAKSSAKAAVSLDVEGKVPLMKGPKIFFSGDQERRGPEAVNIKGVEGHRFEGGHFHNDDQVWFSGLGRDPSTLSEAQAALRTFFENFKKSE